MNRRIVSLWFPRLASDRWLRVRPIDGPFALVHTHKNAQRVYCLNTQAEQQGLTHDVSLSDARALCSSLHTEQADPHVDQRFLLMLSRWAKRYCPWVGFEANGLVLDVTGSTHLLGGEEMMLADIYDRLNHAGMSVRTACADTRGAAWGLARFAGPLNTIAPQGQTLEHMAALPVAALRIEPNISNGLQRLGLRTIGEVVAMPRDTLSRRFGPALLMRLDQVLGEQAEPITPSADPLRFAARLTMPEPIGLLDDVRAALVRLLARVCSTLTKHEKGARKLQLTIRRVDQVSHTIQIQLARAMRDEGRIISLFEKSLGEVDAGFGIDQMHLIVTDIEALPLRQTSRISGAVKSVETDDLTDLITRLGNRVGFDNVTRLLPAQSHIPEKSFIVAPAAYSQPAREGWVANNPRPLTIFPPEIVMENTPQPPNRFKWRRMQFTLAKAIGPERIAPEWWLDNPDWRSGVRDYWHIQTRQGRRLWMFFTPQNPGWFVQGEFA